MIFNQQLGQTGKTIGCWDVVFMDFEGSNNSTTFTDSGTGASVWTQGGSAVITTASPAPLAGTSSLKCPSSITDSCKTGYAANNRLPAAGAWDIDVVVRSSANWATGGTGKYLVSVQDPSATAAGTAFAIATNSSGAPTMILSDGTTRSLVATSGTSLSSATTQLVRAKRRGNTISIAVDANASGTGTFSGSINFPAGRDLRIGAPEFTTSGAETLYFDSLRIRVYS